MGMAAGQAKSYCRPLTSRKFRGATLNNSLNVRHIFGFPPCVNWTCCSGRGSQVRGFSAHLGGVFVGRMLQNI